MRPATPAFAELLKYSHRRVCTVDAYYDGALTLPKVPVVEGTAEFDDSATLKRSLTLSVPSRTATMRLDPGNDPLHPLNSNGQRLHVRAGMQLPGGAIEQVDLGWYLITAWKLSEDSKTVEIQADDLATLIADADFYWPESPPAGATFVSEFTRLAAGRLQVAIAAGLADRPINESKLWERGRDGAYNDLCAAWPARWYVADSGALTAAAPYAPVTEASAPDVTLTDGSRGTITARQRDNDRGRHYNAVVVTGKTGDNGTAPPFVFAELGPDSPISPASPFGPKPRFLTSDLITSQAQAATVAAAELDQYTRFGRAEAVGLIPDPRIELGDIARVYTRDGDSHIGRVTKLSLPLTGRQGAMSATVSTLPQADSRTAGTTAINGRR